MKYSFKSYLKIRFYNNHIESNIDEQMSLPPDHGLPTDPSKWTVRIQYFFLIEKFDICFFLLGFSSRRIHCTFNK